MFTKTKIIATIGPSSNTPAVLEKLILAGMNVARLNFSHGSYEEHGDVIKMIRSLSRTMNQPVGILLDLQGPKIRTGRLEGGKPVLLETGKMFKISTKKITGTAEMVSTTYQNLSVDIKEGDRILLDDGLLELKALSVDKDLVSCEVISGGLLKENKGINLPGVDVSAPSMTEKDRRDLNFGIKVGVDYVALSFVRRAEDLIHIKTILTKQGSDIPVIAKIEKPEAVSDIDRIIEESDAIMVARGDLGVELNPEKVPTIQKVIIQKAITANRPVITATQMLESMIENPIPTRAEASDVANAILDGTGTIMLSGETASGKYPVEAIEMMKKIAVETEASPFMRYNLQFEKDPEDTVTHAVAQSAVNILQEVDAKGIIAFSVSGKTSKLISKQRPSMPVYAFTPSVDVYNRLALVWGLIPSLISRIEDAKLMIEAAERLLLGKGSITKGERIVIITGLALKSGSTNIIKIHEVGRDD
jgi:pyruvate kinase